MPKNWAQAGFRINILYIFLKMVSYIYTYELTLDSFRLVLTGGLPCAPSTYIRSRDPNSDPHACTASSLTTEPRLQPMAAF